MITLHAHLSLRIDNKLRNKAQETANADASVVRLLVLPLCFIFIKKYISIFVLQPVRNGSA